jgi:syntaxin 7
LNKLVAILGTEKDTDEHRSKLRQLVDTTRDLAKDTADAFKKFATAPGSQDARSRIVQDKLRTDFELWLKEFREASRLSAIKERESAPRAAASDDATVFKGIGSAAGAGLAAGVPGAYNSEEDEAAMERARLAEARRQEFEQLEQRREMERALIAERDQGIRKIESTVLTVNEIFTDLAQLVEEQGHMVDNIEANIVSTESNVKQGTQELRKASDYQKKSRTKLCWLLLCVVVLATGLGVAIWWFTGKH